MRHLDRATSRSRSKDTQTDRLPSTAPLISRESSGISSRDSGDRAGRPQRRDGSATETVFLAPLAGKPLLGNQMSGKQFICRRLQASRTARAGFAVPPISCPEVRAAASSQPLQTILDEWAHADSEHTQARLQAAAMIQTARLQNHSTLHISGLPLGTLPDCLDRLALRELTVIDCQLNHLPALPPSLTKLNVQQNRLAALPALPAGLRKLEVTANRLRHLPALPTDLTWLGAGANHLTLLLHLPASLTYLDVSRNRLLRLANLPSALRYLDISTNVPMDLHGLPDKLEELKICHMRLLFVPKLPSGLTKLWAHNNDLIELPELPPGLSHLNVSVNRLHALPTLPPGILHLIARSNRLRQLPPLPDSLVKLDVSQNALVGLPPSATTAPHLTQIDLYFNQIPGAELDAFVESMNAYGKDLSCINFDRVDTGTQAALSDAKQIPGW